MKNSLVLSNGMTIIEVVLIVIGAFAAVLILLSLFASIWKIVLVSRYNRYNKQKVVANMPGYKVAENLLAALNLNDVKVEKIGFFKAFFFGNHYNPRKKTIYLRSNIYDTASLTSVAIASEKVAIAKRHSEGDKKVAVRATLIKFGYFAPFAILPLIIVGGLLDLVLYGGFNLFSIIFACISFVFFFISFIIVILNLKIEKKACKMAIEYMQKTNLLAEDEIEDANHLYKTYITDYWVEFIYNIAFLIWEFFKLFAKIFSSRKK